MRCIGCGGEMRLVKAVADCTMMVSGYEHQTLECEGCHAVERRMVFGRTIGPLTRSGAVEYSKGLVVKAAVVRPAGRSLWKNFPHRRRGVGAVLCSE